MNIEQAIDILKAFRNYNKFYKEENKDLTITITLEAKESIDKAIERLLTAYEKEKEKNKELSDKLTQKICKGVEEEILEEYRQTIISKDKEIEELKEVKWYYEISRVPKDKIKAKIEEYDDKGMTVNLVNRSAGKTFQQAVHYEVKKVLQSLLEKE